MITLFFRLCLRAVSFTFQNSSRWDRAAAGLAASGASEAFSVRRSRSRATHVHKLIRLRGDGRRIRGRWHEEAWSRVSR